MNKLELRLRKLGRELADRQVCRFFKVPEEMTATPCDFLGYTSTGRALLIEAKMVVRHRLPVGKSPGLLAHQWNELCDAHRAGAIPLLVWERDGFFKVLTMPAIVSSIDGKSIPWQGRWCSRIDDDSLAKELIAAISEQQSIQLQRPCAEPGLRQGVRGSWLN